MGANYPAQRPLYGPNLLTGILLFLVGTFLWVSAREFAGPVAEEAAKVQSGEWIVRLAFQVIGNFFIVNAIVNLTAGGLAMAFASKRFHLAEDGPYLAGDAVRFLIGLWLVLTNRFTRPTFQSLPPQD